MANGYKTGGRKKGTPNKKTAEARAMALAFLDRRTAEEIDELWSEAKAESPSRAMAMWLQAQEFVLPRLARTEVSGANGEPLVVEIRKYAPPDSSGSYAPNTATTTTTAPCAPKE